MSTNEHLIQLEAVRKTGPPMDAFIAVNKSVNPDGIEIHPLLLELLYLQEPMKRVPMGTYNSLKMFVALLCLIIVIFIKLKSSCLDKHSHIMFATGIDLFVQRHRGLGRS